MIKVYLQGWRSVLSIIAVIATGGMGAYLLAVSGASASTVYVNHILSTGQSLSIGARGWPVLSNTQPYHNVMLDRNVSGAKLIPLVEGCYNPPAYNNCTKPTSTTNQESISSAMANSITAKIPNNNYEVAVTMHGVGGMRYAGLKKGTEPYILGMAQLYFVKGAAQRSGKLYRVIGITAVHGETDSVEGRTFAEYKGYLQEWQHDYETSIKARTGQADTIPMFTDQTRRIVIDGKIPEIPLAQLAASEENPNKIILVGPKYFLPYYDDTNSEYDFHLTNVGYRWWGEYYGKVIKKVVVDKQTWAPLKPTKITRDQNIIYIKLNVPFGPLVIDTKIVPKQPNYGFYYNDDGPDKSATISKVELSSTDTIKITLNKVPTGTNQRVSYAFSQGVNSGNVRDSDTTKSLYGNTLYNWLVEFRKPIDVVSATAQIAQPTPTVTPISNSNQVNVVSTTSPVSVLISEADSPVANGPVTIAFNDSLPQSSEPIGGTNGAGVKVSVSEQSSEIHNPPPKSEIISVYEIKATDQNDVDVQAGFSATCLIRYDEHNNAKEGLYDVMYWDGGQWSSEGISDISIDAANNTVRFKTNHFSLFAIVARGYDKNQLIIVPIVTVLVLVFMSYWLIRKRIKSTGAMVGKTEHENTNPTQPSISKTTEAIIFHPSLPSDNTDTNQ